MKRIDEEREEEERDKKRNREKREKKENISPEWEISIRI